MAITIRARKGSQIGFKGTTGGSLSWVNQAGQAGRQLAATGRQMIDMADDVKKFFDDEVTESEIRQQVDQMQIAYLKQSRNWLKDMKQGGVGLDENGAPLQDLDPYYYTNISQQNHDKFWEDNIAGKDFDPKAEAAFGVWFESKASESHAKADQWGVKQRYARLNARDHITVSEHLKTIDNDPLIENKNSAFEALTNMHLAGAPHRDPKAWGGLIENARNSLIENTAIENAYGQQGRNLDPSDLTNGYTAQDYSTAIERINKDKSLTKDQKEKIIKGMASNRKTRLTVEKTAKASADNAIQDSFSKLHSQNKLTIDMIEGSNIDFKQKMYWKKQLEGGSKKPWKGDYNEIKNKILTNTWVEENDVVRNTEIVRQAVRIAAQEKGIPSDEIEKLMKDVSESAKASPITAKKKAAIDHAKNIFKGKLSTFERLMLGQKNPGALIQESNAAADNKLWRFTEILDKQLVEGRNQGISWDRMLSPSSPDYIVNDIIDTINKIEPDIIEIETEPKEESSVVDNIIEGYKEDFKAVGEFLFGENESDDVEYEIYGNKAKYKTGVTYEHAKAQVDSQYAQDTYGDPTQRVIYPKEHEGYAQFPEGKETIEAYKNRMKLMGYTK